MPLFKIIVKIYLFLFILSLSFAAHADQDLKKRFFEYLDKDNMENAEKLLKNWKDKDKDPEYYVCGFNYFFRSASREVVPVEKKSKGSMISVKDPKTGKTIGYLDSKMNIDPAIIAQGISIIQKGIKLFPYRMDMRFGLAYVYQEIGDFNSQYKALEDTLIYAKNSPAQLKWSDDDPLPETDKGFLPQNIHNYALYYYKLETDKDDESFLKLARLLIKYYPGNVLGYNDMAAYYSIKKDWKKTLEYLLKAHKKDRQDLYVIFNIAETYVKLEQKDKAKEFFNRVIRISPGSEEAEQAKKRIQEL